MERLSKQARVLVLGRNDDKSGRIGRLVERGTIDFVRCDITDNDSLSRVGALPGITRLIHLAALVKDSTDVLDQCWNVLNANALGTVGLLSILPDLEELYFASTVAVYGRIAGARASETHQTKPEGLYGLSKLVTEHLLRLYCEDRKIGLSLLRISSVFSPSGLNVNARRAINVFSDRIRSGAPISIHGDGANRRDFIYVKDAVEGLMWAFSNRRFGVYNICSGHSHSVNEVVDLLMHVAGARVDVMHKPSSTPEPDYCYDNAKAIRDGFSPGYSLEQALKEVYFEDRAQ